MIRAFIRNFPFKVFNLVLMLLFIASCITPPPMIEEPVERYWEVEVPMEATWKASIKALVEKGVMISILDKDNHLMVLEEPLGSGSFCRVTAEKGRFFSGVARVTLLFTEKSKEKTGININTALQGFTGRYYLYVTSNGKLEKDYYLLISNSLPIKKTYKWLEEDTEEGEKEKVEEKEGRKGIEKKESEGESTENEKGS